MTILVIDGQGGGIGRALISATLPLLPEGTRLYAVGTNAMATAAMLRAGGSREVGGKGLTVSPSCFIMEISEKEADCCDHRSH